MIRPESRRQTTSIRRAGVPSSTTSTPCHILAGSLSKPKGFLDGLNPPTLPGVLSKNTPVPDVVSAYLGPSQTTEAEPAISGSV
jgi:hypothetical protein